MRPALLVVLLGVAACGCELERAALLGQPSAPMDASTADLDAHRGDGASPPADAASDLDAFVTPADAGPSGMDAFVADAFVPEADACAGRTDRCDGVDQDCDGRVDEDASDCPCAAMVGPTGHAYLFCSDALRFDAAQERCRGYGYSLVVVDDDDENALVRSGVMATLDGHSWIGLSDTATEGTFTWVDGRVQRVGGTDTGYSNWGSGEPNDFLASEDCVEMINNGRWNDVRCDDGNTFVCEASPR